MTLRSARHRAARPLALLLLAGVLTALDLGAVPTPPSATGPEEGKFDLEAFREQELSRYAARLATGAEHGHRHDAPLRARSGGPPPFYPPADPTPPIDVQHYIIDLDLHPADSLAFGRTTISGEVTEDGLDTLRFDYCGAAVTAVELDGQPAAFTWDGDVIAIPLVPPRLFHDDFTVVIEHGGVSTRGLYFPRDILPQSIATFTFSEPEDARRWYPCRDVPDDKATFETILEVPGDHVAASNGEKLSEEVLESGRRRFHFRHLTPMSTYLATVVAAPYVVLDDDRHPTIPMTHYVYPGDSAVAMATFAPVPDMLDLYAELFGPYPFDRYGHAQAPFPGGMEHQTLTMVGEFVVRDGDTYEWLIAHEVAHHWWGDSVTLEDWRHIWLNEGFASYADALWFEKKEGRAGLLRRMRLFADLFRFGHITRNIDIPVFNPPSNQLFSFVCYDKGAWVVHMLRRILGDDVFFAALREYQSRHRHGVADTDDFIAVCEELHGADLDWFFTPWLNGVSLARYRVETSTSAVGDGRHAIFVTVHQEQEDPPFTMPVDVAFRWIGGEKRRTVWIDASPFTFSDTLDGAPADTAALLDPDEWILKTVAYEPAVAVRLVALSLEADGAGVVLRWRAGDDARNVLFRAWRAPAGAGRDAGDSAGPTAGPAGRELLGADDRWLTGRTEYAVRDDAPPVAGADYWVEALETDGTITWHGPVRRAGVSPTAARLAPIAPNPARDAARLEFTLAAAGPVTLDLYDAAGRRVARLVDEVLPAGTHLRDWRRVTDRGQRATAGLYFARLTTGAGAAVTRKLVVVD
jgi:aminopeptidase N